MTARYIGRNAAQAYLDDTRHFKSIGPGRQIPPRQIMDEHFQRVHDSAVELVRECFLNMLADAKRFDEDVDGDCDGDGRPQVFVSYHITTDESQFRELVEALGIKIGWDETTLQAVERALEAPVPSPELARTKSEPGE